jgi:multidrug efflux pump subunit AcrA (membrane-fusion protein)
MKIRQIVSRAAARWGRATAVSALSGILLLSGACGFGSSDANSKQAEANEIQAVAVTTAEALTRDVPVYIEATGSFVADEFSDVAPLSPGRVVETPVDVGAFVEKGQVIARLDQSDAQLRLQQARASAAQTEAAVRQAEARIGLYGGASFDPAAVPEVQASRAAYESAQAEVKLAEADAQRYANLVKTGDVSQSAYEKARTQEETAKARADAARRQYEAAVNAARQNYGGVESAAATLNASLAQVGLAEKALADTVIRAPISGYVSERPIAVGEYVGSTAKIATILRAHPIKLALQVPEGDAGGIHVGMPVTARVAAFPDRDFEGQVSAVNPAIDPSSRTLTIEAKFSNPKLELKPGMFATAHVLLPGSEQAVLVPKTAVLSDPNTDSAQAFVIEDGRARVRVVRLGDPQDGMVRILSGVSAGETVAVSNLEQLYDGVAVQRSDGHSNAGGPVLSVQREATACKS